MLSPSRPRNTGQARRANRPCPRACSSMQRASYQKTQLWRLCLIYAFRYLFGRVYSVLGGRLRHAEIGGSRFCSLGHEMRRMRTERLGQDQTGPGGPDACRSPFADGQSWLGKIFRSSQRDSSPEIRSAGHLPMTDRSTPDIDLGDSDLALIPSSRIRSCQLKCDKLSEFSQLNLLSRPSPLLGI